jgi:hypothetical protein
MVSVRLSCGELDMNFACECICIYARVRNAQDAPHLIA